MPTLETDDGMFVTDEEKAEILAQNFQKHSSDEGLDPEFRRKKEASTAGKPLPDNLTDSDSMGLQRPISLFEQMLALKDKRKGTAPGPDLITYEMLRKCHPKMKKHVNDLFNDCLKAGYYPRSWRVATVVAVPKPGKSAKNPENYRPIALTSQLGKTYEIILKKRLTHFCEMKKIIPPQQSGFRKKRCTQDHLAALAQRIVNNHRIRNKNLVGVFLDIQKAYDNLWREGLLRKLRAHPLPRTFYKVIESFLSDRTMRVRVGNCYSSTKLLVNGVPQGSVISPLLFNIMISDLVKEVQRSTIMQFADDTSLLREVTHQKKAQGGWTHLGFEEIQEDLDRIVQWFKDWGFKLSVGKTQVILFRSLIGQTAKSIPNMKDIPRLRLGNTDLEYSDRVKFLGVTFSSNGTYGHYINEIVKQAQIGINLMRAVSGQTWGAHMKPMMSLYHAHVMSRILYAAPILVHINQTELKRLRVIQTQALRIALGVPPWTAVTGVHAETGQPEVWDIIRLRAASFYFKVQAQRDTNPSITILETQSEDSTNPPQIRKETETTLPEGFMEETYTNYRPYKLNPSYPTWTYTKPNIDLTLTSSDKHTEALKMKASFDIRKNTEYSDHRVIYTDGSHDPETGATGVGIYFPSYRNSAINISSHLSIFTAELTAIKLAITKLRLLEGKQPTTHKYLIATDSLSSLQALQNQNSERQDLVFGILQALTECARDGIQVDLIWVPSHIGIKGNEIADELAKRATNPPTTSCRIKHISHSFKVSISPSELKALSRKTIHEQWKQKLQVGMRGRRKTLSRNPSHKPVEVPGNRKQQALLYRMRLGGERNLIKKEICSCQENMILSAEHILLDCKLNHNKRTQFMQTLQSLELGFTLYNLLNPPKNLWNHILNETAQLVSAHPQGDHI